MRRSWLFSKSYRVSVLLLISSIGIISLALFIFISLSVSAQNEKQCTAYLVETIPEGMPFPEDIFTADTYTAFLRLINSAEKSIDIASYYWSLQGLDVMPDPVPEASKGEDILRALLNAARLRSVSIRIAVNDDVNSVNNSDLTVLSEVAQIRKLSFPSLLGSGILHSKFLLIDGHSFYLGSTNMDWRALTHVKELGLMALNCQSMAADLTNIFAVYWYLGESKTIPSPWPDEYSVTFNQSNPQNILVNQENYQMFFSSSPPALSPLGRTDELEAVLDVINSASSFIYIAIMDYYPMFLYSSQQEYWPLIDNALRKAVIERKVQVRLLASQWTHTRPSMVFFLKSLSALGNPAILGGSIETKFFTVPPLDAAQPVIPFSRVNHNKYMITDGMLYISTNNWSADYFVNTGGASILMKATGGNLTSTNLHGQLKAVFERDWNSVYSSAVM